MLDLKNIEETIQSYFDKFYQIVKLKESSGEIIKEIVNRIIEENNITEENNFNLSQIHFIDNHIRNKISVIERNLRNLFENKKDILTNLDKLLKLELPEQRSKEWYGLRDTMLTASSLADALGKGHFKTRDNLLIEKSSKEPPPRFGNAITEWGVMYEQVATTFYEKLNNLEVLEFGLVPHSEFKIFGASPDGICSQKSPEDYIGRMLEIKCPPKRKFTKEVPEHYWMQMQGQLECCDLEECDFLQVKLEEYQNKEEYQEDTNGSIGESNNNFPKGLVLSFITVKNGETKYHYEYSEFYKSLQEIEEWSYKIISNHSDNYDTVKYHWWRIERYECTLVLRDRDWWNGVMPEILNFWEDVEHYREVGNQELIDKKEEKKKKRNKKKEDNSKSKKEKKSKNIITINQEISTEINNNYLLGSESE